MTCMFYPYDYIHLAEALSGVTGHDYARQNPGRGRTRATAGPAVQPARGPHRADDRLPKRVMRAFREGPLAGHRHHGGGVPRRAAGMVRADGLDAVWVPTRTALPPWSSRLC